MPELSTMETPKTAGFVDSKHSNANRRRAEKEEKEIEELLNSRKEQTEEVEEVEEKVEATKDIETPSGSGSAYSGSTGGRREFGMNKGGLIKKPIKKKTKTKTKK